MRVLVTGSAGHLGEALVRTLRASEHDVIGIDVLDSPFTDRHVSILDRDVVRTVVRDVDTVLHAATLHKPHVASHDRQRFIDVNVTGTLHLLEESAAAGVRAFVFTSSTSVFGDALTPPEGEPAAWITEDVVPVPKNIYGVSKRAAEDLCQLFHRNQGLPCVVLRTSRFFPEEDDDAARRAAFDEDNLKVNELLYRRVDLEDAVRAHLAAMDRAPDLGFARYVISATPPFRRADAAALGLDAARVVRRTCPGVDAIYDRLGWRLPSRLDRVYDNALARRDLQWTPRFDFAHVLELLDAGAAPRSELAVAVGSKGYHRV